MEQLTAPPFITDIKISPSGEYIAVRIFDEGKHHIRFMALSTFAQLGGIVFPGSNEVGDYYWVNDERVVTKVLEQSAARNAPKYYGELFAANFDGSDAKLIFGYRTGHNSAATHMREDDAEYAWAEIVDVLPDDKKRILISSTGMSRSFDRRPEAILLNTYTGKESRRVKASANPGGRFYTDKNGKVRLVTSLEKDGSLHLQALPVHAEQWIDVP